MKHARKDYDRIQDPEGKIAPNEPVFLLRAQDKFAGAALQHYAWLLVNHGGFPPQHPMVVAVQRQALAMYSWPYKKVPDVPDVPTGKLREV